MKCEGQSVSTGERIEVEFDSVIQNVDPVLFDPRQPPGRGEQAAQDVRADVTLTPGFIDIQVNGFAGVDYNSPSAPHDEIARSIRAIFSTGVTRFFPTVITGAPEDMLGALRNLSAARGSLEDGLAMEAFHVEGPHICPDDGPRGAHSVRWVRPPDLDEYRRWQEAAQGNVRLVTLSPEWPEAPRYIEMLSREGVATSIGHTGATREQIRDAVSAGATLSTHLGNAAHAVLPRRDNYIWDQLAEDRLAASFIVDGLHLSESFLRVALRTKGIERSILITDAVMPAMCEPGFYRLGEIDVELMEDQRVVLRDGTQPSSDSRTSDSRATDSRTTRGGQAPAGGGHFDKKMQSPASARLAGSSLRMDRAIGNVMRQAGLTLTEAVTMATLNPARVGRVGGRQRGIRPGERADLVRFRSVRGSVEILDVFLSGRRVYSSEESG